MILGTYQVSRKNFHKQSMKENPKNQLEMRKVSRRRKMKNLKRSLESLFRSADKSSKKSEKNNSKILNKKKNNLKRKEKECSLPVESVKDQYVNTLII